jgi:hypothetical protein
MKIRSSIPALIALLAAGALPAGVARASSVLYDSISVISGQQSTVQSFNVSTPGTLTVTLSTLPWLDPVTGLNAFLTTASGMVGTAFTGGTETFDVTAGTYYAHWFGTANGTYNLGVVGMEITFQPSDVTAVPLPASLVSMLSAIGLLVGWQSLKGRRRVAVSV